MNIEYEATFANVDKNEIQVKLSQIGAEMIRKEFMQKRAVFCLPDGHHINGGWLRVRDEGDKITMSLKVVDGDEIHNQKETMLTVDNYEEAKKFLTGIGCVQKSYQESLRELWILDGAEITIDEWPFLEPFVEIEGQSVEQVKAVADKIGFDYSQAKFCATDVLISEKYGISIDRINNQTPQILFEMENPFQSHLA
jgi:adenylate cyclase class 2